jgi:hypothetical protein
MPINDPWRLEMQGASPGRRYRHTEIAAGDSFDDAVLDAAQPMPALDCVRV